MTSSRLAASPVELLAERVGTTPFFAYDRRLLDARVGLLRTTLPDGIDLSYAVKANPMPAVVQHLSSLVDCFDVASALEMRTGLDTPMPAMRISFAGPGKTPAELSQAVAAGVTVTLESRTEAERVISTESAPRRPATRGCSRQPGLPRQGVGHADGRWAAAVRNRRRSRCRNCSSDLSQADVEILGFHVFAGSQNLDAEIIRRGAARDGRARDRARPIGPGTDHATSISAAASGSRTSTVTHRSTSASSARTSPRLLDERIRPSLPEARVVVELGRYIVGECGVYVTRVLDRKISRGKTFVVVDGGLHHQLAASGNFGQVIRRNYPVAVGNRLEQRPDGDGERGRLPVHAARPARRRRRASRRRRSGT